MKLDQMERFILESRLVPQEHAYKLLKVALAAREVERTSGCGIAELAALSEALHVLEDDAAPCLVCAANHYCVAHNPKGRGR